MLRSFAVAYTARLARINLASVMALQSSGVRKSQISHDFHASANQLEEN